MTRMSSSRREWGGVCLAVSLGLVLAFYVGLAATFSVRAAAVDFGTFFASTQSFLAGESIYPLRTAQVGASAPQSSRDSSGSAHGNLNPPVFSLVLAPLTVFGLARGYLIWVAVSVAAGLVSCYMVWRELNPAARTASGLVGFWIVLLAYYPTYTTILLGQVTLLVSLPLTGAWIWARRGHDRLAGAMLGFALSLKLFIALVLIFCALQRRWRLLGWAVATAAAITLVTLPFVGTTAYRDYAAALNSVTWFANSWNASYASFFTRVLGGSDNQPLANVPRLSHAVVLVASSGTVLWLAWLTRKRSAALYALESFDLSFGLTIAVMLLVSPLGWMYYFPLLMLPGYAAWSAMKIEALRSLRVYFVLAWVLSSVPTSMVAAINVNDWRKWFTINSIYFYALAIFTAVLSVTLRRVNGWPTDVEQGGPTNTSGGKDPVGATGSV